MLNTRFLCCVVGTVVLTPLIFLYTRSNLNITPPPPALSQAVPTHTRFRSQAFSCLDVEPQARVGQRANFWVLYNYVLPERRFRCRETITYTTHADYTFLDNLETLLERWKGPVSIALYAPGDDFPPTVRSILWARQCGSPLVSQFVSFHVYFDAGHLPSAVPRAGEDLLNASTPADCTAQPPWVNVTRAQLYRTRSGLLYPVNVGRNVAREQATTHFLLASDIELYPSPGLIPQFLDFIEQYSEMEKPNCKVFPLSLFEIREGLPLPENKSELVLLLRSGDAVPFHQKVCASCHALPGARDWPLEANATMSVFLVGKRTGAHVHWEPIYIGTKAEPEYDERLSWEGKADKMTQGYAMCVLDYEFHILNNAFLVHKPGIKLYTRDPERAKIARKQTAQIRKTILPEMKILYGTRKGCDV